MPELTVDVWTKSSSLLQKGARNYFYGLLYFEIQIDSEHIIHKKASIIKGIGLIWKDAYSMSYFDPMWNILVYHRYLANIRWAWQFAG